VTFCFKTEVSLDTKLFGVLVTYYVAKLSPLSHSYTHRLSGGEEFITPLTRTGANEIARVQFPCLYFCAGQATIPACSLDRVGIHPFPLDKRSNGKLN
jgi:hypothetical protein